MILNATKNVVGTFKGKLAHSRLLENFFHLWMRLFFFRFIYLFELDMPIVGRVFANGPEDLGSMPRRVISKTLKMVLDTSLLNTQQYKVRIKAKVEQSRERSCVLPYTSVW